MNSLEIALLGPFHVTRQGQPVTDFRSNKVRALLAYLAAEADRGHTRPQLAGLFWPDSPEDAALNNLSQTLGRLRQNIGDEHLLATRHEVRINPASANLVDVNVFVAGTGNGATVAQLEAAVARYRGDFLTGFVLIDCEEFENWLSLRREFLRRLALDAMHTLTSFYLDQKDYVRARQMAGRQLVLDNWREAAYRQLMVALAEDGLRSEALQQYELCRQLLQQEIGVAPEPATVALYQAIKTGSSVALPTPATLERPRHNLSGPLLPLIGRPELLQTLVTLLAESDQRLVTLLGPGGVGKTRLALAVAEEVASLEWPTAQPQRPFRDGVWFVPLAGVESTTEALGLAIVNALGITLSGKEPVMGQLLDYLRQKQMVLVLDNFEHLLSSVDLILDLLRTAPAVTLLVTSRIRLTVDVEQIYVLDGLSVPPAATADGLTSYSALQLFGERARRAMPTFTVDERNAADVAQICRLVDGLPLGIELAAQWVPHFTPSEIAASIQVNLDFLAADEQPGDSTHRSLRAVFEHSWHLLTEGERQVLAQMAIFRGGFSRQAALTVTGATLSEVTALLSKSLVRLVGSGRYEMHEMIRLFAGEKQQTFPKPIASLPAHHAQFYAELLSSAETDLYGEHPQKAIALLRLDLQNIQQAWSWATTQLAADLIAQSERSLARFYRLTGAIRLGAAQFQLAARAFAPIDGASLLQGQLWLEYARFQEWLAAFDLGNEAGQVALSIAQARGARTLEAAAYSCLGTLLTYQGQHEVARSHLELAVKLAESEGQSAVAADSHYALARVAFGGGEYAVAHTHIQTALALYQALGDRWAEGRVLSLFGVISYHLGDGATGQRQLEEGLRLFQRIEDPLNAASALQNLGALAAEAGEYEAARRSFQSFVNLVRELGIRQRESTGLSNLGLVAYYLGQHAEARQQFEAALHLSRTIGDPIGEGMCLIYLSLLYQQAGDHHAAYDASQQALALGQAQGHRLLEADAWLQASHALAGLRPAEAPAAYQRALALQTDLGHRHTAMEASAGLARLALSQGDIEQAMTSIEEILTYLAEHSLDGAFDPFLVYLTCYQVLETHHDPRTQSLLDQAHTRLVTQANKINDPALQDSFLHNVAVHRAIIAARKQEDDKLVANRSQAG